MFLPNNSLLILDIVKEMHFSAYEGMEKTLQWIMAVFFWKGMKKTVNQMVRECEVCQRNKSENRFVGVRL